jgi:hypothetical protein
LGIAAGVLTAPATGSASTTSTTTQAGVTPTFGLGLTGGVTGPLDISTKTGADMARSTLLQVLSSIQSTYQTTNAPPPASPTPGNNNGSVNASTTAQLANYGLALSLMNTDPNNAVANIQQILSGGGNSGSGMSSLLQALQGLGG